MSDVAVEARRLAFELFPRDRVSAPPPLNDVETALARLRQLRPLDGYDEAALAESEETLLRLRDAAWAAQHG